ncbi:aldehyde dehydrogenase family protein [Bradyrhizobium japonicum]
MQATLRDARTKGAVLVNLAEQQIPDAKRRKFAPHLVLNPTEDMIVMQREIFGPILPIKTYADRQEVADYINSHDRPLAIYPFTHNAELRDFYISRVMSGGVSVNEALLHVGQHDLPFGGVGASGMGHYHAREGFNTFSKLRPVFYQGPLADPNAISAALRGPPNEHPADDDQVEDVMREVSIAALIHSRSRGDHHEG